MYNLAKNESNEKGFEMMKKGIYGALISGAALALAACSSSLEQQPMQPSTPRTSSATHSQSASLPPAYILGLRQQAYDQMNAKPRAESLTVSGDFKILNSEPVMPPPTAPARYHSLFFRSFDNSNANGATKVAARVTFPEGVRLVGAVYDRDSAIPKTLKADTLFSPDWAASLKQATARRYEDNQDFLSFVDAKTASLTKYITNGADDARLILDYGTNPAPNLSMKIELDPSQTTEPGIMLGNVDHEVMSLVVPLTDAQGNILKDATPTFVTPVQDLDLIVLREGSAFASDVSGILTENPYPEPIPTPTPTPDVCDPREVSAQTPSSPQTLVNEDFTTLNDPTFANDPTNPFANWVQWGADYYTEVGGVQVYNPGPGLGDRDQYQEYTEERPDLLESGIYKRMSLVDAEGDYLYKPGDKLIAKFDVDPRFTHEHSDSDIGIILYNACSGDTVAAYGRPVRGPNAKSRQIYVELEIPQGMTEMAVSLLGYLGSQEAGTVIFKDVSVEQVPQHYYTASTLYADDLAQVSTDFGPNSPAVDAEFGYDFYTVETAPGSGDKAATAYNHGSPDGTIGGLVKRVDLPAYHSGAMISAKAFAATTFSTPDSFVQLKMEYYNAQDELLGEEHSTSLTAYHYDYLRIDRAVIPTGTSYIKFVPLVSLGLGETSSLLLDNFSVELIQP